MQMLLIDTNTIVMDLIRRAKKSPVQELGYQDKAYRVSIQLNELWTATLTVQNDSEHNFPAGTIALEKDGYVQLRGFFSRHRTPLLFEYAMDFCRRVNEQNIHATQELLKEALSGLFPSPSKTQRQDI